MKIFNQYQYSFPHKKNYYPIDKNLIEQKLKTINLADVYVHIPFCSTKCGYCNLFSVTNVNLIDDYLKAIKTQYQQINDIINFDITSFTIGGGTPVILSLNQIEFLLESIKIDPKNYYSNIELSPNETTKEKLDYIKNIGFNRVSIGVQSLDEEELKSINRHHKIDTCLNALDLISQHNFDDFNVDIIYGINGQTIDSLKHTIKSVLNYNPTEIFIYPLYVRENTWLYGKYEINQNKMQEFYYYIKDLLNNHGYYQTSMRKFTRKKVQNLSCGFSNTISYGCGGRSYIDNFHFCSEYSSNSKDVYHIINEFNKTQDFLSNLMGYNLNEFEMKQRFIIKNLLSTNGLSLKDYYNIFNSDLLELEIFKENKFNEYLEYKKDVNTLDKIILKDLIYSDFIINLLFNKE